MYFGGTIMTFALPYGAFIVVALVLFFLFRAKHTGPKLKYLATSATVASVTTREPGPVPAPPVTATAAEAAAAPETTADEATEPETTAEAEPTAEAETPAEAETAAEAETTAETESEK
jgi:hypothetical protein